MGTQTIGICAYNEEKNIGLLLDNLLSEQDLPKDVQVIIVCSGCVDNTPEVVRDFAKKDKRVKLVVENDRRGKASALNILFKYVQNSDDKLFLLNADTSPQTGSIRKLVPPLNDPEVGATMGRPIPINEQYGLSNSIVHIIWDLHHKISLYRKIKFSAELCALRGSIIREIPHDLVTDEPFMEMLVQRRGYRIVYVPNAVVYIRGPDNLADLFEQRRRILIGHLQIQERTGFAVSTSSMKNILLSLIREDFMETLKKLPFLVLGGIIEMLAFLSAHQEFRKGKLPFAWKTIESTKQLRAQKLDELNET